MNADFKECLSKNKIMEFSRGKTLASNELKIAEDDYKTAKMSFTQSGYKWATVQAYYSGSSGGVPGTPYLIRFRKNQVWCPYVPVVQGSGVLEMGELQ